MLKRSVMLTCMLFLGAAGTSQAHPLDSPDIVYIDGMPCNSACQSYMAWSRKMSSVPAQAPAQPAQRSPKAVTPHVTGIVGGRSKPAAHARISKQAAPNSGQTARAKTADLQAGGNAAGASGKTRANTADSHPTGAAAANSNIRTIQEQVAAATAVAEHVTADTAVPAPEQKADNADVSGRAETIQPGQSVKAAPVSPDNANHLVALVMARPEIKSVTDLANNCIAIDDRRSASYADVKTAIAAAGVTEVQLSQGQTKAIDRLISGEVSAAVLALAYPEAADWFPEIAGFRIFRIPLPPRSSQARLEPAGNAPARSDLKSDARSVTAPAKDAQSPPKAGIAANSNIRTIQQQVAAATALAEHATAATAPEPKASNAGGSETARPRDAGKTASAPPDTDRLVVLLIARPEIKLASDLTSKIIAIDDRHSASNGKVRTAIAAAGAAEIKLSEEHTKAIDRLVGGEVPAAVLTLVSSEAAEWFPEIAGFRIFRIPLTPRSLQAGLETAGDAVAKPDAKSDAKSVAAPAKLAESPANSNARTIQQQVAAATALAEHVTAATPATHQNVKNAGVSSRAETVQPGAAENTASAPPDNTDRLVALLMARAEIKSVSDLTGKEVAIEDERSASIGSVRTAIAAAGAAEIKFSEGHTKAIDRLIGGEVSAAILTLVSPEAADWFPEIAGFRIFRIPLSPRSLKARL